MIAKEHKRKEKVFDFQGQERCVQKKAVYWMHNVIRTEYCDHSYEMKTAGIHAKYMDSSCFVLKILIEKSLCGAVQE